MADIAMGVEAANGNAARRGIHARADDFPLRDCAERIVSVQDTGIIQAISQAPQTISFSAMAEKQQALADVVLKDPAVESLSSFIGIDGTNTTLNSGRMLINLKPLNERKVSASDVIPPFTTAVRKSGRRHALHAGGAGFNGRRPRQPDAIPVHVGRCERR
jgi:multidrug efflux pump subunit AcrB